MKSKFILAAIAALVLSLPSFGQYFNHYVPDYGTHAQTTQTITKGNNDDIVFLSTNKLSPNYPNDFSLLKMDVAGNYLLEKDVFDPSGSLVPSSIIHTTDGNFIVVGTFIGTPPPGYPPVPGGIVHTTFYAKFDDHFNMLWYNLHYGHPLDMPSVTTPYIDPKGIIAVPGAGEEYIILNFARGFDTYWGFSYTRLVLDKINGSGALIKEVEATISPFNFINDLSSISYLPSNKMCAVMGNFTILGWAVPPPRYPFLLTFDKDLMGVNNFTFYSSPGITNLIPSNVVEDPSNPFGLMFAFNTDYPSPYTSPCTPKLATLALLKVKAAHTGVVILSKDYTSSCMGYPREPLTIKNIPGDPFNVMLGFTEEEQTWPGWTQPISLAAMMKLGADGSVFNYHIYNQYNIFDTLRYVANYTNDSFILHVEDYFSGTYYSTYGTRVIKTDADGKSFCATLRDVDVSPFPVEATDSPYYFIENPTVLYHYDLSLTPNPYGIITCDSDFAKPAHSVASVQSKVTAIKVYPNPATDELNISLEGALQGDTYAVNITNAIGQDVISQQITCNNPDKAATIDVHHLQPGFYILRLFNNGVFITKKTFVKQ